MPARILDPRGGLEEPELNGDPRQGLVHQGIQFVPGGQLHDEPVALHFFSKYRGGRPQFLRRQCRGLVLSLRSAVRNFNNVLTAGVFSGLLYVVKEQLTGPGRDKSLLSDNVPLGVPDNGNNIFTQSTQ